MSTNDNLPHDDTLADEVFVDDTRRMPAATSATASTTATLPATDTTASTTTATTATPASTTTPTTPGIPAVPEQQWLRGPAPFALVLGILGLVVAGAVLVSELTEVSLPWDDLGPWSVVLAGLVVLLVGAIGLRSSRNRNRG